MKQQPRWCALGAFLVVALAGAAGGGCGRPDVVFCNTDTDCANGEICTGGSCAEGTPFRGRPGDVVEQDPPPPPPDALDPCGTIADSFDATTIAEPLWSQFTDGGAEVGLADGELVVALPAQVEFARAGVATGPLTFKNRAVTTALPEVPGDQSAWAMMTVQTMAGAQAYIIANGDMVATGSIDEDGNVSAPPVTTYNGQKHRFIRMREDLGELVFESSADDVDYNELGRVPAPASLGDGGYLYLVAQAESALAPTTAAFNSISSPAIQCD